MCTFVLINLSFITQIEIYYRCVYIPCENSTFYLQDTENCNENGIQLLQDELVEVVSDNCDIILIGDFNSRCGDLPDYIHDDSVKYFNVPEWWPQSYFCKPRKSCDKEVNNFGRVLLELCLLWSA